MKPQDSIKLLVETNELGKEFLRSVENEIVKPTNISEIVFENTEGEEIKIGNLEFKVKIEN